MDRYAIVAVASLALLRAGCAALSGPPQAFAENRERAREWLGRYSGTGGRFLQRRDYRGVPSESVRVRTDSLHTVPAALILSRTPDDAALRLVAVVDAGALRRADWMLGQPLVRAAAGALSLRIDWEDLLVADTMLRGHSGDTSWILERRGGRIEGALERVDAPARPEDVATRTTRTHLALRVARDPRF